MNGKLYVVGVGPGGAEHLTRAAESALKNADCLVVARRHLPLAEEAANVVLMENLDGTLACVAEKLEKGSVAVAVSGDAGIFSYLKRLRARFPNEEIEVIPGVSALQALCAAIGETWDDAAIASVHGRNVSDAKIAGIAAHHAKSIFFCGPEHDPARLCRILAERGLDALDVAVGERLSYLDARITRGRPAELENKTFDGLSVVRILNPDPLPLVAPRPSDTEFLRSDDPEIRIPMTREEVRTIVLDKLCLTPDSVVWDVGAGTGSVSVACALACPYGDVHAVERLADAVSLLRRNKKKFKACNLWIHEGNAASLLDDLPCPTHVFVGGSGGELRRILEMVRDRGANIRIVVSGVTLKTVCVASEVLGGSGFDGLDVMQVSISRGRPVGVSFILTAQNPVTLLSAVTRADEETAS